MQKLSINYPTLAGMGLLWLLLLSCNNKKEAPIVEEPGLSFRAISDAAGGRERWKDIQSLSFTKEVQLLDSLGSLEIDRTEYHNYNYENNRFTISYTENDTLHTLIKEADSIYLLINKKRNYAKTTKQLFSQLNAATFVMELPYSLENGKITALGSRPFLNQEASAISTTFAGSPDIWTFYYQPQTLDWLGYWVQTVDHNSLVVNDEMILVSGFMLSRKRTSYRTNEEQEKTYVRARYRYSDYQIDL